MKGGKNMFIPMWGVVLLVSLAVLGGIILLFAFIYMIAIVHDLLFVKLRQPTDQELQCPFERESKE